MKFKEAFEEMKSGIPVNFRHGQAIGGGMKNPRQSLCTQKTAAVWI